MLLKNFFFIADAAARWERVCPSKLFWTLAKFDVETLISLHTLNGGVAGLVK